ncbi:MAG: response regulator, partial [Desulfobulbus sp.]
EVQKRPPNLVIIDYHLGDMAPLDLAKDLLKINALVNIAVVSTMNEEDFHEATEGLGLLPRLPSPPLATDGPILLKRLREVSGLS